MCSFLAFRCGTPQHKKKNTCVFFFGATVWYTASHFCKCEAGLGLPKNSVACKLVYIDTTRPIRKKCRGTYCAAAQSCGRGPRLKQTKKRTLECSFLEFRCGTPQHKKKEHLCVLFWRLLRDSDPRHFG